jgi:hypothetical protein
LNLDAERAFLNWPPNNKEKDMGQNKLQDANNTQNGMPDENSGGEDETRSEKAPTQDKSDAHKTAKQAPKTG